MPSAVFCNVCNLLVFAMIGEHVVFAYSSIVRVIVLYVTSSVSLVFPQYVVSYLSKLVVCLAVFDVL